MDLTTTLLLPECQYAAREQCQKAKKKELINRGKLVVPEMREKYLVEVRNKYEALSMETDGQGKISSSSNKKWQRLKLSIQHANETAPKVERKAKQCWMTEEKPGKKRRTLLPMKSTTKK